MKVSKGGLQPGVDWRSFIHSFIHNVLLVAVFDTGCPIIIAHVIKIGTTVVANVVMI